MQCIPSCVLKTTGKLLICVAIVSSTAHASGEAQAGWMTTTSPSGAYTLHTKPDDEYLRSSASYRLSMNGKDVWAEKKPYSLGVAYVLDDGRVVGIAYRTSKKRPADGGKRKQYLHVVILDSKGKEVLNEITERRPGPSIRIGVQEMVPSVSQLLADPANDRIIVRGRDDNTPGNPAAEFWWTYRLSTGKLLKRERPGTHRSKLLDTVREMLQIALVPGTPLILVHWRIPFLGARFTLVSPDGLQVWSLDLDDDYVVLDANARRDLKLFLSRNPAILPANEPGRFTLREFARNERVTYSATQVGEAEWAILEDSRVDYLAP